ncbi:hypothetical protein D3C81_989480 [compost metagenome]
MDRFDISACLGFGQGGNQRYGKRRRQRPGKQKQWDDHPLQRSVLGGGHGDPYTGDCQTSRGRDRLQQVG